MKPYPELLQDPRWQRRRLEIMHRDNFTCRFCLSKTKTLNVHHLRYIKGRDPWDYDDIDLITVCDECHELAHSDDPFPRIAEKARELCKIIVRARLANNSERLTAGIEEATRCHTELFRAAEIEFVKTRKRLLPMLEKEGASR